MTYDDSQNPLMAGLTTKGKADSNLWSKLNSVKKEDLWISAAKKIHLPAGYELFEFDGLNINTEGSLRSLCKLLGPGKRVDSVLLSGIPGSGKTGYLACMARELFYNWAELSNDLPDKLPLLFSPYVRYLTFSELSAYFYNEEGVPAEVEDSSLLLLDGLFDSVPTAWASGKLGAFIEGRWRGRKTTWITTSRSAEEIKSLPAVDKVVSCLSDDKWIRFFVLKSVNRRELKR